jgi:AcrR family transcriptional regulator
MSSYHSPRRADAATATRAAILDGARGLFLERGYSAVTVPEIASAAGVAVQTVYSSAGGKAAILSAILTPSVTDRAVEETRTGVAATDDPCAVIDITARGTRDAHERHWEVIYGLFRRGLVEPSAAAVLDEAIEAYLGVLAEVADRLIAMKALRPELDRVFAIDLLWLHLGQRAWFTLVGDRGWDFDRTQAWLAHSARHALLKVPEPPEVSDSGVPGGRS